MNVGDFDVLRRILPQKASFYGETARFIAMMGLPEEKFLEFSRAAEAMRFELARQAFDQGKIHFAYYTISRAESYFRRALSLLDKIRFIPGGAGGSGAGSAGGAAGGAEGGVPGRGAGGGVPGRSVAVGSVPGESLPGRSVAGGSVMGSEEGNGPGVVGRGGSVRGGGVLSGVAGGTGEDVRKVASGEAFRGEGGGKLGEVERSVLEGDGGSVLGGDGEEMLRGVLVEVPERARNQEKIGPAIDRREAVERGNVFGSPGSIGARFQVQEEEEREEAKEKISTEEGPGPSRGRGQGGAGPPGTPGQKESAPPGRRDQGVRCVPGQVWEDHVGAQGPGAAVPGDQGSPRSRGQDRTGQVPLPVPRPADSP